MRMGLRKNSKNFYCTVTAMNGEGERESFRLSLRTDDPDEAEGLKAEVKRLVKLGESMGEIKKRLFGVTKKPSPKVPLINPTFEELMREKVCPYWRAKNRSFESYHQQRLKPLLKWFGTMRVSEITSEAVDKYKYARKREVLPRKKREISGRTVNMELAVLKAAFRLALKKKWITGENQVQDVEKMGEVKKGSRILTHNEIERVLVKCPFWHRPLVLVLWQTGMRIGELLTLTWRHVDFDANTLKLKHTKTNTDREVSMTPQVRDLLWGMKGNQKPGALVFQTSNGTPYLRDNVRWVFQKACRLAGIKTFRIHDLRHSMATHYLQGGGNVYTLSKILGHSNVKTTEIYAKVGLELIQKGMKQFGEHLARLSEENCSKIAQSPLVAFDKMLEVEKV